MIVKCQNCGKDQDIGEGNRDNQLCGNCYQSLADRTAEIEHNKKEIEKLRWQPKESNS